MTNEQFRKDWGNYEQQSVRNIIRLMDSHRDKIIKFPYSEDNKDGKNISLILNQDNRGHKPSSIDIVMVRLTDDCGHIRMSMEGADGRMYYPDNFVYGMMTVLYGAVNEYYYGGMCRIEKIVEERLNALLSEGLPYAVRWVNENIIGKTDNPSVSKHMIFRQNEDKVWRKYAKERGVLSIVNAVAASGYNYVSGAPYCWFNSNMGTFNSIFSEDTIKTVFGDSIREVLRRQLTESMDKK